MTNTNKHQSKHFIFSGQADTSLEQQISTPGLVYASSRTAAATPAGVPCVFPLAVEKLDIARDSARLPASPKAGRPNHSLHSSPAGRGLDREIFSSASSRTNTLRPDSGANTQTHRHPRARETHQFTDKTQVSEEPAERPRRGVWQDNARFSTAREASRQPAAVKEFTRSQVTNNHVVRSQNDAGARKKLSQVTLWVDPVVKAHLERLALQERLSISAAGAAFLKLALQQSVDMQYSALLQPIIEKAIAKQMRGISTRLAWLLVRVSLDSGQTRSLVTNIRGRQQGMTTDLLRSIVKQSAATARGNITRRTPQLEDVIQSIEQWILTDEKSDRGQSN